MDEEKRNTKISEEMIINFMESDDRESTKNFCKEILSKESDNDTAFYFDRYTFGMDGDYEYFFEKFEDVFDLVEKKNYDIEEKATRIKRYMVFTNNIIKDISSKQVLPTEDKIFEYFYRHVDMIRKQKDVLGEDVRNYLCREVMASLKKILDPICRMHTSDLDNVIKCCYIYGDLDKKTKAIINKRDHMSEKDIEEEIGGEILKIQEEIDKIKPEYDNIMKNGNFIVKILPKTKELAVKIMGLVVKQRKLVEEYMDEVRVPYYYRVDELWQYHEKEIDEIHNKNDREMEEKVEAFSEKYKVENHFYFHYLLKYEKIKLKNKKKHKKYDPAKKGNFFEI